MKSSITLRNVILGGQDGLVNVLGLSLGLFAANSGNHLILVAGLAAGFSEAISMGAVAYTSALAETNPQGKEREILLRGSIVVGVAAIIGALIPLLPFIFFNGGWCMAASVVICALVLYFVGSYQGKVMNVSKVKSGIQLTIIGLVCAFAGFLIGLALKTPSV